MLVFRHEEQQVVAATPQAVFDLLGDPARHARLAGSGEVKAVRLRGDRSIRVGSSFEADEAIRMGRSTQRFTAVSTVTEYEPPHAISWTSMPPSRPRPRRIQRWYHLEPVGAGTRVTERVEVDLGAMLNLLMRPPYSAVRGSAVRAGMVKILENLEQSSRWSIEVSSSRPTAGPLPRRHPSGPRAVTVESQKARQATALDVPI
jgi:uncharacterized protein YndB with AHSA1/START domain